MDEKIIQALQEDLVIDITTIGRKSGKPRRIEMWFHNIEGRLFFTGSPGTRDWYANMLANPEFTFHLKESLEADLPARSVPILDETERREIILAVHKKLGGERDIDARVASSPLVEVILLDG